MVHLDFTDFVLSSCRVRVGFLKRLGDAPSLFDVLEAQRRAERSFNMHVYGWNQRNFFHVEHS